MNVRIALYFVRIAGFSGLSLALGLVLAVAGAPGCSGGSEPAAADAKPASDLGPPKVVESPATTKPGQPKVDVQ
jgi:hypothetical protein